MQSTGHASTQDASFTPMQGSQLMESTGPDSPIEPFLLNHGQGLHHLTLEVEDIELEMRTLLARTTELIDREPRLGLDGRIAFVSPSSTGGVLLALNESPSISGP